MRENNAYPPLFWGKWPKHRIDKQKLYNLPFATIYISHIFADISAIIEISETHKWKIWHQEIFRFMVLWRILGTKGQRDFTKSQGFVANFTVLWRIFDTNVLRWISSNERIHSHSRVGLFSPQKTSKNLHFRCKIILSLPRTVFCLWNRVVFGHLAVFENCVKSRVGLISPKKTSKILQIRWVGNDDINKVLWLYRILDSWWRSAAFIQRKSYNCNFEHRIWRFWANILVL